MRNVARLQQALPFILIIMILALVSYNNANKVNTKKQLCVAEKAEGTEVVKVKSGFPIWESLSRHLIRVSR